MIQSVQEKNYSLQFTYMLLSQYEFLYSSLVGERSNHALPRDLHMWLLTFEQLTQNPIFAVTVGAAR